MRIAFQPRPQTTVNSFEQNLLLRTFTVRGDATCCPWSLSSAIVCESSIVSLPQTFTESLRIVTAFLPTDRS